MESSRPLVFDISSDEEEGFDNAREGGRGCQFGDSDDCDWLSELLVQAGGGGDKDDWLSELLVQAGGGGDKDDWLSELLVQVGEDKDDCSNDVVLVSDALEKPRPEIVGDGGDDDDCVVLDGDPDKPVVVAVGDDDDVQIVAEKGEVACRDFPHARHLCSKFQFASTPHQSHCTLCHCYVCDTLAPCFQWGIGNHCHATDKDKYWKTERERERIKKSEKTTCPLPPQPLFFPVQPQPPLPAQSGPHPSSSVPVFQCLSQPINPGLQNYLPRPQQINPGHLTYLPHLPQQINLGRQSYLPQTCPTYVSISRSTLPTQTRSSSYPLSQAVSSYQHIPCLGTRSENDNQPSQPSNPSSSSAPHNLRSDFQQVIHGQNDFKPCDSQPQKGNHSSLTFDGASQFPLHDRVNFLLENHYSPEDLDVPVSPLWRNG